MKDNVFDDLIRNRLKNHESSVSGDMWIRITGKVKKRKTGFLRYLLLMALILIGVPAIYYFQYSFNRNRNDISFNKNSTQDSVIRKAKDRSNKDENNFLPVPGITKQDGSGTINSDRQANKQGKKQLLLKNQRKKKETDYNTAQLSKPGNDKDINNNREVADYVNNTTDSLGKKPVKESKVAKADSLNNAEGKGEETENDKFSIELYTSPDIPVNGIRSDNKSYEQVLKGAGNMRLSYTVGARISYAISNRISAKTGVQYTQVNERINFSDSQGNSFTSTNRYKTIGVPLLIGYKAIIAGNLHLSVNTGVVLNIISRYNGVIPSISGQAVDIKRNNVYNKNVNATLCLGIDVSKRINRRTDFFAEPTFSYRLKNMVNHFYSFSQKIYSSGLSFGLRYRLFKNSDQQF